MRVETVVITVDSYYRDLGPVLPGRLLLYDSFFQSEHVSLAQTFRNCI